MNHFSGIRTIGVPVGDQDAAVEFYTKTLGFEVLMDAPLPQLGGRWIVVTPPEATAAIALTPATDENPAGTDTGIRLATPDASAAREHLRTEGVETSELLSWPGVPPMFTFRDQDGNTLYVTQD
jgi:catechol 2,3-dioxygenase-like lactoylglutathione lyase family enzyme